MKQIMHAIIALTLLPGCFPNPPRDNCHEKYTYLVQGIADSSAFSNSLNKIGLLAENIIKEELGLENEHNTNFFIPKKLQRITLYYITDMCRDDESFLLNQLNSLNLNNIDLHDVSLTPQTHFFGDNQDELVIIINDPDKELTALNEKIKTTLHRANNEYQAIQHHNLYDIAKSERFPYLPHMGLGRIRTRTIKEHIKNQALSDTIYERIKERIEETAKILIEESIALYGEQLAFEKITVLNMQKQIYIKDYANLRAKT